MRIACVHIPQLALQHATRLDPSLRGAAVVVTSLGDGKGPLHSPIVIACSRAAWALGARLGMTATAARGLGDLAIVQIAPAAERETARALADALLGVAPVVDIGGRIGAGLEMYAGLPPKTPGAALGEGAL